jgi:hypothetical protein
MPTNANYRGYDRSYLRRNSEPTDDARLEGEPGSLVERGEDLRGTGMPDLIVLCGACRYLNDRRIDLDRRIAELLADECCGDEVWQELGEVLEDLGTAAERLAQISATQLTEVRAKAEVLTILMRLNAAEGGPVVPQDKAQALTLSLADDLGRLLGDGGPTPGRWTTGPPGAVRPTGRVMNRWLLSKYIRPCRNKCH